MDLAGYPGRLSRLPSAEAAIMIFNFDSTDDIEMFIKVPLKTGELGKALNRRLGQKSRSGAIPLDAMYSGFGQLVEVLDGLRPLYLSAARRAGDALPEVNTLFRRVSQLMRWRFYFISHETRADLREAFLKQFLTHLDAA